MKKIILTLLLCFLFSFTLSAQKASTTKAYNLFYDKDYIKAKETIDLCIQDEKLTQKAQTWLYKANIYFNLANQEYESKRENDTFQPLFPDAAEESYDAFIKAIEINKNVEAYGMMTPEEGLSKLYVMLLVYGVDEMIAGKYEDAKRMLEKAVISYESIMPHQIPLNGELYYYYAYTLGMLNDHENASNFYNKAIRDGSNNVNVYINLIENYKKENNQAKIKEIIDAGKKSLPNSPEIYVCEIDYYIYIEEKEAAHKLMENLPASIFENSDLLLKVANFFIIDNNYSKAYDLLTRANQITPNNFIILYNLGVCTYYLSEDSYQKANQLDVKGDHASALIYKTKSENLFLEAQDHFEFVHRNDPQDITVMYTLRSIYARLQSPKYEEMDSKIKATE